MNGGISPDASENKKSLSTQKPEKITHHSVQMQEVIVAF